MLGACALGLVFRDGRSGSADAAGEAQATAIPSAQLRLAKRMGHDIIPQHIAEVVDQFLS